MAIRKDQSTLSDDEKQAFVAAILALKQAPSMLHPGAPTSSCYDDYVELHVKAMMAMPDGWPHQAPRFLSMTPCVTSPVRAGSPAGSRGHQSWNPYWDWIKSPTFLAFLGGDGDPSKGYKVTDGPFIRDKWVSNVVDFPGAATYLQRRFGFGDLDQNNQPIKMNLPDAAAQDAALKIRWYDDVPWDASSPRASSFRQSAEVDLYNRAGGNGFGVPSSCYRAGPCTSQTDG